MHIRTKEVLGRTDIPIVLLRKQLDEQIARVERGEQPMNVFPDRSPDIIFGSGTPPTDWTAPDWATRGIAVSQGFRKLYHKGSAIDDADRYGPAIDLAKELHRRIEEAELA